MSLDQDVLERTYKVDLTGGALQEILESGTAVEIVSAGRLSGDPSVTIHLVADGQSSIIPGTGTPLVDGMSIAKRFQKIVIEGPTAFADDIRLRIFKSGQVAQVMGPNIYGAAGYREWISGSGTVGSSAWVNLFPAGGIAPRTNPDVGGFLPALKWHGFVWCGNDMEVFVSSNLNTQALDFSLVQVHSAKDFSSAAYLFGVEWNNGWTVDFCGSDSTYSNSAGSFARAPIPPGSLKLYMHNLVASSASYRYSIGSISH